MSLLITGGLGFIGSHLADKLLQEGYRIFILDRNIDKKTNYSSNNEKITCYECNLPDLEIKDLQNQEIDGIFHLAMHPRSLSMQEPLIDVNVNVKSTIKILELAKEKNAKVIFASNCGVYGDPKFVPVTEEHPINPLTIYDANKVVSEYYCEIYNRTYGLSAVTLRLASVYGERQKIKPGWNPIIPEILHKLKNNLTITIFGDGNQTRDFINVKDVVDGMFQAFIKESVHHGVYNISTGLETSINQLVGILSSKTGKSPKCNYAEPLKNDIQKMSFSYKKAQQDFGFKPKYDLNKGLDEYVRWENDLFSATEEKR